MNKENQLSLLETKDMNIVSFDELANILGGTSTQENEESHDKGKGQESGHAGGLICWC
ncbi:hypothetical protein [Hoylesella loescheii]|jgi:hypothetical protein|uniref:hypothetical protein n=1 Tax=Hoylesella loescheii TaxID=840 RepID=UPI00248DC403|nr:hypothetical protein [Hoylesella loescheii]